MDKDIKFAVTSQCEVRNGHSSTVCPEGKSCSTSEHHSESYSVQEELINLTTHVATGPHSGDILPNDIGIAAPCSQSPKGAQEHQGLALKPNRDSSTTSTVATTMTIQPESYRGSVSSSKSCYFEKEFHSATLPFTATLNPIFDCSNSQSRPGITGESSRTSAGGSHQSLTGSGRIERPQPGRGGIASARSSGVRNTGRRGGALGNFWWICPFVRINPKTHFKCLSIKCDSITHLKQHISRNHKLLHCPNCIRIFETTEERDEHQRSRTQNPCEDRDGRVQLDGFTESHIAAFSRTRFADSREGWDLIWEEVVKRRNPKPFQSRRSPLIQDEVKEYFAILYELIAFRRQEIVERIAGMPAQPRFYGLATGTELQRHMDFHASIMKESWREFIGFATGNPTSNAAGNSAEYSDGLLTVTAELEHDNMDAHDQAFEALASPSQSSANSRPPEFNLDASHLASQPQFGGSRQSGPTSASHSLFSNNFRNSSSSVTTMPPSPDRQREVEVNTMDGTRNSMTGSFGSYGGSHTQFSSPPPGHTKYFGTLHSPQPQIEERLVSRPGHLGCAVCLS